MVRGYTDSATGLSAGCRQGTLCWVNALAMEIYDRVQAETTKAGLSEPIGWVMLSFRRDAWQNWSHNEKAETSGRAWCLPGQRFPREICARGTREAGRAQC